MKVFRCGDSVQRSLQPTKQQSGRLSVPVIDDASDLQMATVAPTLPLTVKVGLQARHVFPPLRFPKLSGFYRDVLQCIVGAQSKITGREKET